MIRFLVVWSGDGEGAYVESVEDKPEAVGLANAFFGQADNGEMIEVFQLYPNNRVVNIERLVKE